ncbi:PREDICTED: spermatogenesis- and oogenesis-specific basic helix-loop-helix-containing protein 1 [Ceratotherium simum simum]|uniref:Spermatogenesis- and oogenesis-specific basic helix-loop-helix-containing protein 1 n=1 Tax=Ceratotherium simum simum TaxID=73337 RepID=A0ABM1CD33_CERSS|nr:PREDICTED: spermatogenesis- and oogenesis-specific basic helix-loop-helix-containing protein 1 [Ceratotherium simum simum]
MASVGSEQDSGVLRVLAPGECSGSSLSGAQCFEDPGQGSGPVRAPVVAEGPSSCLPRNVLSERERRKRISMSCEHLRALLPRFDGRREDMASVLEMSVQFLRLASALVPSREQHTFVPPAKEMWHKWQKDVLQLVLASQIPAGAPDPGTGASGVTMQQDSPSCATEGVDEGEVPSGVAEVLDGPLALLESPSLVPRPTGPSPSKALRPPPLWPRGDEAQTCLGQAGPPAEGANMAMTPDASPHQLGCGQGAWCWLERNQQSHSRWPVCARRAGSALSSDVEDRTSFLLTASPDWWLGSLEGRGGSAPARSTPSDRAELSFLVDPEPGSQELSDGPLEPWGSDVGGPGLALRDEVDSLFPEFFTY